MEKYIMSPDYYSDEGAKIFISQLEKLESQAELNIQDATLYYHHPILKEITSDELLYPDVMIISNHHGVLLFKINSDHKLRDNSVTEIDEYLSQLETVIFSKLIKSKSKNLKKSKRELAFPLTSFQYTPLLSEVVSIPTDNEIIYSQQDLHSIFSEQTSHPLTDIQLNEIYSIIESTMGLTSPKERDYNNELETKADILKQLENEIATFDDIQKYAAFSQLNGPQRIRGLAGSGKTIILCLKAALLHLKYPEKKILYTFMTKSLYDFIENLITKFYKQIGDGRLPDLEKGIIIRHAWGGKNLRGVYSDTCKFNNVIPVTFETAMRNVGREEAFDYICKELLRARNGNLEKQYDYVLIDEAQDLKPSFYQICREIVKNDCLVWGYDELQNIFDVKIQNTLATFQNEYGAEGINLSALQNDYPDLDNDIVLSKCYRNPREVLVLAHSIGLGIYNDNLIQSLENNSHWKDLGYTVKQGDCTNGSHMIIVREAKNSPLTISTLQEPEQLIEKYNAQNLDDEMEWVASQIEDAILNEKLRPDDISVISLDDRNTKLYFQTLSNKLFNKSIYTNNLSINNYERGFYKENCVTLSTVYKAKGNEAAMVFVIGCDVFEAKKDSRTMRNKAFTAFTRTKAWLKISGVTWKDEGLWKEINQVFDNNFILDFTHKDSLRILRDLDEANIMRAQIREAQEQYIRHLKSLHLSDEEITKMVPKYKAPKGD